MVGSRGNACMHPVRPEERDLRRRANTVNCGVSGEKATFLPSCDGALPNEQYRIFVWACFCSAKSWLKLLLSNLL